MARAARPRLVRSAQFLRTPARSLLTRSRELVAPSGTFASLVERNFRLFFAANTVCWFGRIVAQTGQDLLVLQLSQHNPTALGITTVAQFGPSLLLSLWAGGLADRKNKRQLLVTTQAGLVVANLAMGTLLMQHVTALWPVYLLAFITGVCTAIGNPVAQAFLPEIVDETHLNNAISLDELSYTLPSVAGPTLGAALAISVGFASVFLLNAAGFAAVVVALVAMNPRQLRPAPPAGPRRRGQTRESLHYVWRHPNILGLLGLWLFAAMFGATFFVTLPATAANVFHTGAAGYGSLATLLTAGGLAGSIWSARNAKKLGSATTIGSGVALGVTNMALGLMPSYWSFAALLTLAGATVSLFQSAIRTALQRAAQPSMRGRVACLYWLLAMTGNVIDGPMMAWLQHHCGGRAPYLIGGAISTAVALSMLFLVGHPSPRSRPTPHSPPTQLAFEQSAEIEGSPA